MNRTTKKFTLKYHERLHKKFDFSRCFNKGTVLKHNKIKLIIYTRRNSSINVSRIGLVTSKKIGIAVLRNKTKRLLREIFRCNKHLIQTKLDIIIILNKYTIRLNYQSLHSIFVNLLKKGGYYLPLYY
jgi:ribonuclease P protein component